MKAVNKYWGYLLTIILLLLAIAWLITKSNSNVTSGGNDGNKVANKTGVAEKNGDFVEMKNPHGKVVSWQANEKRLEVNIENEGVQNFVVDPSDSQVMIPIAQRKKDDEQLYNLKKASGQHWETAFCPGDYVSFLIDNSKKIIMVLNSGFRMCGYQGAWE